jgi:hypothetical protein
MTIPADYRAALAALLKAAEFYNGWDSDEMDEAMDRARTLLAAPETVGVADDRLVEIASNLRENALSWEADARLVGNISAEDIADLCDAFISRFAHPAPVSVGEKPWRREGWCDAEGRCWLEFIGSTTKSWQFKAFDPALLLAQYADICPRMLPHWALPLPGSSDD